MIAQLKETLLSAQRIALVCHVSPDMDALGSAVGLRFMLEEMGKQVCVYAQDPVPGDFLFIEGMTEVQEPDETQYDLCVSVDVSDLGRMGTAVRVFENAEKRAMIDHHATTEPFCETAVIRSGAAATAEILVELFREYGWKMNKKTAMALWAGLSTDSGNFSYENVTGETMRAAAACVDCGAEPNRITEKLYRTSTEGHVRMMGRVLSGMELLCGGKAALLHVYAGDFADCHADQSDSEGIINIAKQIESVQVSVMLSEREGQIKCSLRSNAPYDVSVLAASFGGGGHARAAGCSFIGETMEQAEEKIRKALAVMLK